MLSQRKALSSHFVSRVWGHVKFRTPQRRWRISTWISASQATGRRPLTIRLSWTSNINTSKVWQHWAWSTEVRRCRSFSPPARLVSSLAWRTWSCSVSIYHSPSNSLIHFHSFRSSPRLSTWCSRIAMYLSKIKTRSCRLSHRLPSLSSRWLVFMIKSVWQRAHFDLQNFTWSGYTWSISNRMFGSGTETKMNARHQRNIFTSWTTCAPRKLI